MAEREGERRSNSRVAGVGGSGVGAMSSYLQATALRQRLAGYGGVLDDVANLAASHAGDVLSKVVMKIEVETSLFPKVEIDDPFGSGAGAGSAEPTGESSSSFADLFLSLAKPQFTAYTPTGPVTIAPWGKPSDPSYWPFVSVGLLLIGVLAGYGGYSLAKNWRKRK